MAHITGGGLPENLPRVLPEGCQATIDTQSWEIPAVFKWLQSSGNIETPELYRTFNCGIGMVLCIPNQHTTAACRRLNELGEEALIIGEIQPGNSGQVVFRSCS